MKLKKTEIQNIIDDLEYSDYQEWHQEHLEKILNNNELFKRLKVEKSLYYEDIIRAMINGNYTTKDIEDFVEENYEDIKFEKLLSVSLEIDNGLNWFLNYQQKKNVLDNDLKSIHQIYSVFMENGFAVEMIEEEHNFFDKKLMEKYDDLWDDIGFDNITNEKLEEIETYIEESWDLEEDEMREIMICKDCGITSEEIEFANSEQCEHCNRKELINEGSY